MADESISDKYMGYVYISAETIIKAVAGDQNAIQSVMERYTSYMKVVLRDIGHKNALRIDLLPVEDIMQSVWLQFISDLKKFRILRMNNIEIEQMFDSYCTKSLLHNTRDNLMRYVRHLNHYPVYPVDTFEEIADRPSEYDFEKIKIRLGDTDVYLSNEKLAKSLDQLSPKYKQVIALDFFMGLDESEIAKKMDIKINCVYQYKYKALKLLKSKMKEM